MIAPFHSSLGRISGLGLVLLAFGALIGCSESSDGPTHSDVRRALDEGQLDRASALIAEVPSSDYDAVRDDLARRVADAMTDREERRKRLVELRERIPVSKQRDVLEDLRALKRKTLDRELSNEIELVMSQLPDLYRQARESERSGRRPGSRLSQGSRLADLDTEEPTTDGGFPTTGGGRTVRAAATESTSTPTRTTELEETTQTAAFTEASLPKSAKAWRDRGRELQSEHQLKPARDAFAEAAKLEERRSLRTTDLNAVSALEDRLLLRQELQDAFRATSSDLNGILAMDDERLVIGKEERTWAELTTKDWSRLEEAVQLSGRAELGLVRERLLVGDEERGFKKLRELERKGRAFPADVNLIVSEHRGEVAPDSGYAWSSKGYVSHAELQAALEAKALAKRLEAFDAIRPGRDVTKAWNDLLEVATDEELLVAIRSRHERLVDSLQRDSGLKKLEKVAEARKKLDVARERALELIFDEEQYFYPYRPPECPPEKAKEYPAVQRRVDELVGSLRDAWKNDVSVKIDDRTAGMVKELTWLIEESAERDSLLVWPESVPKAVQFLDFDKGSVGLHDFATSLSEKVQLSDNAKIRALNESRWKEGLSDEEAGEQFLAAITSERKQVRITNDYRIMFGRRALAWNPRLQRSTQDHSRYMSDTGNFGHYEEDPETKTPFDRMRRRGYDRGVSENCYMGGGDPMGAHAGWCRSSGHHRNLLMIGHREMASAVSGSYWTQNFGTGDEFRSWLE